MARYKKRKLRFGLGHVLRRRRASSPFRVNETRKINRRGEGYLYKERWGGRAQLRHGAYYPVDQRSKIKELTGTEKNGRKNGDRSCKISGQVALGA